VRYLGAIGTERDWSVVRDLERGLARTRPQLNGAIA
jgi:hypothetical protein